MLAAHRFATRPRPISAYRIHYSPLISRYVTNGTKPPPGPGANKPGTSQADAARQQASDKIVKEYLDSIKPPTSPTSSASGSGKPSTTSTPSTPPSESAASPPPTPLADQLNSEARKASQSFAKWKDATLGLLRSRAKNARAEAAVQFSLLGGKLNKITGYDEIEVLKRKVIEKEKAIDKLRAAVREAKDAYSTAVATRASCQGAVNDLLSRKPSWSDADLQNFTKLVREDHTSVSAEAQAKINLEQAEAAVDAGLNSLTRAILDRYHEEQIWSDKIRSVNTYGSLAALIANLVVFILAIVLVEPWKRKRLAQTFEQRITEMSEETRRMIEGGMKGLEEHFEKQDGVLAQLAGVTKSWPTPVPVDHEPVSESTPVTEPTKPVPSKPPISLPPWLKDSPMIDQAKVLLGSLTPATDRDYALLVLGGVSGLIGSGVVLLFRSSR